MTIYHIKCKIYNINSLLRSRKKGAIIRKNKNRARYRIFVLDGKGTSKIVRRVFYLIEDKSAEEGACKRRNILSRQASFSIKKGREDQVSMVLKNYEELVAKVKAFPEAKRVIVAAAGDEHTLEAIVHAQKEGIVVPVLVGDAAVIQEICEKIGLTVAREDIYDVPNPDEAAAKAVALIHEGKGDFIMKGKLETAQILKPVVNKETGLGTGRVMSHFVLDELPYYHKLIVTTDGGMMTYPTLEQKRDIIINTVETLKALGYENPKIACVAAVEKVNPKMPETIEAHELEEMNKRGEIKDCTVCGPISLDIALDKEIAHIKGFTNPVAGDADAIIVPNIHVGNVLGKSITVISRGRMAGFIVGAKVPIVLTSRGSSAEEKFLSLVLASAATAAN